MAIVPVTKEMLMAGDTYITALETVMNQYIHALCVNCGHEMYTQKSCWERTSCSKCGGGPLKTLGDYPRVENPKKLQAPRDRHDSRIRRN